MGLIIYAGRNQHVHFDDPRGLDEWPHKILDYATSNYPGLEGEVHPDFFIRPGHPRNLAADIVRLLDWRSYEIYITDMRRMLNLPPLSR